jgi:hypothetical protein
MRVNQTTWSRALKEAKRLQPDVMKVEGYSIYIVDSTAELGIDFQCQLGDNRFNPIIGASCDCKEIKPCVHIGATFLFSLAELEGRLWNGCDYITEITDQGANSDDVDSATKFWLDLLDRYERAADLLKAIEQGYDISTLTGPFKDRLWSAQQVLLTI